MKRVLGLCIVALALVGPRALAGETDEIPKAASSHQIGRRFSNASMRRISTSGSSVRAAMCGPSP